MPGTLELACVENKRPGCYSDCHSLLPSLDLIPWNLVSLQLADREVFTPVLVGAWAVGMYYTEAVYDQG